MDGGWSRKALISLTSVPNPPGLAQSPIDEGEELRRLVPIVTALAQAVSVPISVDTSKAAVAKAAIKAGAVMVNDVTALRGDPAMADVVAQTGVALVLMHMQGTPQTMQQAPTYRDVVEEVADFLAERARFAMERGVAEITDCP